MPHMVGSPNEDVIWMEGQNIKALIDTGSQINTISVDALDSLNPKPLIRPCKELEIKRADGNTLPYLGYVAVLVDLPFFMNNPVVRLFLVVPTTEYNKSVPVIVGTNLLREFKMRISEEDLIPEPWQLGFQAITNNQVGVVRATTKIILQPMEVRTVHGFVRKRQDV